MSRARILTRSALSISFLLPIACNPEPQAAATTADASKAESKVADKPLAQFQIELLEVAFQAASAFPVLPHIKNRSRTQEAVVDVCFDLDQPRRALGYVEKIDNWRRGSGYADFAFYCATHDDLSQVEHFLELAAKAALSLEHQKDEDSTAQSWQRDRIRARIASTHLWLGQSDRAAAFEAGLSDSETGDVRATRAKLASPDSFDAQVQALDEVAATGNFDQVKGVLDAYAQLYSRFYEDGDRRSAVEKRLLANSAKVPPMVRIELILALGRTALEHQDQSKALELVEEARLTFDSCAWTPEYGLPLRAGLAGLRHAAGDRERAKREADAVLASFDAEREKIVDIYRARILRPLAEAYHSMGDGGTALAIYRRAVEEGFVNPNSRPRAEDLSATCCSMATHEVEPDDALRARILEIAAGLGDPW